ncbi:MAG: FAD-dependent oxidoreductase, partial [Archaeoglobaceae archaeon]
MEIVIVGAGATGLKCAARARRRDGEAKITVVDKSKEISLARCGLPYFLSGVVHEVEDLRKTSYGVLRDEEYFKRVFDIEVLTETEALEIDREKRVLKIRRRDEIDELNYDYLVISTGAEPVRIFGGDERIVTLFSAEDAGKILKFWENGAEKAVVIGAGFIGLECCEALRSLGLNVVLVEMLDQVAPFLDREIARFVEAHLKENGVEVLLSRKVKEIFAGEKLKVLCDEKIEADFVVQAIGVKPNVELARRAGIEIGETGAIKVNEFLQTNDKRIYAGGDCVENKHLITGKGVFAPFGDIANKHGRIIADNITGGRSRFPGILGTSVLKVFNLTVAKTGLSEKEAISNGMKVYSVLLSAPDKSHYYPKSSNMRIKLVFGEDGRLFGAQIIGQSGVDKRIDVFATAIYAGLKIDEIANLDLAYSPPYSPAIDPVITSAYVAMNKRDGLLDSTRELGEIVVDLRSEEEVKGAPIANALNIPITKIREMAKVLPKDKEITAICPIGL